MGEVLKSGPADSTKFALADMPEEARKHFFSRLSLAVHPVAFRTPLLPISQAFVINPKQGELEDLFSRMKDAGLGQHKHLRGFIVFDPDTATRFSILWPYHYAQHDNIRNILVEALGDKMQFEDLTYMPEGSSRSLTADFQPHEFAKMYRELETITSSGPKAQKQE